MLLQSDFQKIERQLKVLVCVSIEIESFFGILTQVFDEIFPMKCNNPVLFVPNFKSLNLKQKYCRVALVDL